MLVFAGATLPNHSSEYPMVKLPMVSSVTKTPIPGKCNPRWIDRTSVVWHSQDVLFVSWSVQIKRPRILDPHNYNISEFLERTARQIIFKKQILTTDVLNEQQVKQGLFWALRSNYPMQSLLSTDRWCPRKKSSIFWFWIGSQHETWTYSMGDFMCCNLLWGKRTSANDLFFSFLFFRLTGRPDSRWPFFSMSLFGKPFTKFTCFWS